MKTSIPMLRYVVGSSFIVAITALMNYDLAYLTSVLALGYLSPGSKPLTLKQGFNFIIILILITGLTVVFSELFLDYALVFMPILALGLLWLYFTDKLPVMVKLFLLMSLIVIPFVSIDSGAIGTYVAVRLVFNALMAIVLTQIIFLVFPLSDADIAFEKAQQKVSIKSEKERFSYAVQIIIIMLPVLLLFYIFKLSSSVLILIFIAILSMSPALANPKVGLALIAANILGGVVAILVFELLVIVPNFTFMILLTLCVGLLFGSRLFSKHKLAVIFGSGFSTFLLILGSVTASDAEAGDKVWTRVIQITIAVIYVVVAFGILDKIKKYKMQQAI
ncbi:MAG: DUF2955 domain-containing protein [Bacteroidetes bacterium]|nr:DUF2955 domain-containing protein [Bacteroidota bacterium]